MRDALPRSGQASAALAPGPAAAMVTAPAAAVALELISAMPALAFVAVVAAAAVALAIAAWSESRRAPGATWRESIRISIGAAAVVADVPLRTPVLPASAAFASAEQPSVIVTASRKFCLYWIQSRWICRLANCAG